MDFSIDAVVSIVQIALAGFVVWGGWLSFSTWLRGEHLEADRPAIAAAKPEDFERVASLVLLALLCTTLAGLA